MRLRLPDSLTGLLAFLFGVAVLVVASRFPPTPGQNIGPGLFPMLIGGGLSLGGLGLIASSRRKPAAGSIKCDQAVRGSRGVLKATLVIGMVVFYALAVETVGFFITAPAFLAVLFAAFGVRRRWIAPLAAGVTLTLHFAFYTLLRVPLPWGWLEGMAW